MRRARPSIAVSFSVSSACAVIRTRSSSVRASWRNCSLLLLSASP